MYFPNPEFMHLGDHIFFEPLANILNKNFDFKIMPINSMEFYFDKLGYKMADGDDITHADLIITRKEFFDNLENKKNVLYIDLASLDIETYICDDLIYNIANLLNINYDKYNRPNILSYYNSDLSKFSLDEGKKYLLFNNYVDSASYRVTKQKQKKLMNFCKSYAKQNNLEVIHIGSKQDKEKDNYFYEFVDLDLRGKTSIEDIFRLVNSENIVTCISYDTFLSHIFSIYKKESYIIFRGRFTKKAHNVIVNNFLPSFKSGNKLIYLL
jgi:hypothetical protein